MFWGTNEIMRFSRNFGGRRHLDGRRICVKKLVSRKARDSYKQGNMISIK